MIPRFEDAEIEFEDGSELIIKKIGGELIIVRANGDIALEMMSVLVLNEEEEE